MYYSDIITDRIRRMREGSVFSLSTPGGGGGGGAGVPWPGPDRVGVPHPGQVRMGGTPVSGWLPGVPPPLARSGRMGGSPARGVPTRGTPTWGQDSTWRTWRAAVGMPLAFTQEDCLVIIAIITINFAISFGRQIIWESLIWYMRVG